MGVAVDFFASLIGRRLGSVVLIGCLFFTAIWGGCSNTESEMIEEYLARVGERVITVRDFNQTFELNKTAYSHSIRQNPIELREAKLRVLNQMILESMILQRAQELAITVTPEEVEAAVDEIQADYPEGEFEKTLLEFAVSFDTWKSRLKDRMVIERLIDKELKDQVNLSSEEIAAYYRKNYQPRETKGEADTGSADINESIIVNLRRDKAERAYDQWILNLKGRYPVEVNQRLWEKVLENNPRRSTAAEVESDRPDQP
jgi:hypothetical protein